MKSSQSVRPVRLFIALSFVLTACGGSDRSAPSPQQIAVAAVQTGAVPFAQGPINTACLVHQRRQATRSRCGCIQAAADLTLSQSQQQRSVTYFNDPGRLQEVRQSDAPANERFWADWRRFSETAEVMCRNS